MCSLASSAQLAKTELAATKQHAHPNPVFHCLSAFYNLGYIHQRLAHVYNKDVRTIGNWIQVYEDTGTFQRANTEVDRKFTSAHREWLNNYYQKNRLPTWTKHKLLSLKLTTFLFQSHPFEALSTTSDLLGRSLKDVQCILKKAMYSDSLRSSVLLIGVIKTLSS